MPSRRAPICSSAIQNRAARWRCLTARIGTTKDGADADAKVTVPAEYRAYVGRYRNHSDEGPEVRVFVRRGQLMVTPVSNASLASELVAIGPATFRLASPAHSPERYVIRYAR